MKYLIGFLLQFEPVKWIGLPRVLRVFGLSVRGEAVRQDRTRNLLFFRILFLESSSRRQGYKKEEPDDLSIIGLFL
jgi:hypothetical protein